MRKTQYESRDSFSLQLTCRSIYAEWVMIVEESFSALWKWRERCRIILNTDVLQVKHGKQEKRETYLTYRLGWLKFKWNYNSIEEWRRLLKSTSASDKLKNFPSGKKIPFSHQIEWEHFLCLQLKITSKHLSSIFCAFRAVTYSRLFDSSLTFQNPSPVSISLSLFNIFFRINLKVNFQIFTGFGTTEKLQPVWCLFQHAFYVSARVLLLTGGYVPCMPSKWHNLKHYSWDSVAIISF